MHAWLPLHLERGCCAVVGPFLPSTEKAWPYGGLQLSNSLPKQLPGSLGLECTHRSSSLHQSNHV
eukprot:10809953-Prorocentrum_lima.AAC.1